MITKLKIANFKSHKLTELSLGYLTLLTGLNSSGKSSVLHSFLLLRQSFKKGRLHKGLDLNEPLVDIGKGNDALYRYAKENEIIKFELSTDDNVLYNFCFDVNGRYDDSFIPAIENNTSVEEVKPLPFFNNNFQYLSASRLAAIEFYPVDSYAVEEERQVSRNYGQGELVAHFLEFYGQHRDFSVSEKLLLHPNTSSSKLIDQVIAWEQEISPRLSIRTQKVADKITFNYGYKSSGDNIPLDNLSSKNIGFGISYSLGIVVAILAARKGDLLLIENPEAHLHPKGQSKLAELICLAAQSGIQLIIESHSDHIFNGLRKSIFSKKIGNEKVKTYFFKTNELNTTVVDEIKLSEMGRITNPVRDFFDQFDNDLDELIGL